MSFQHDPSFYDRRGGRATTRLYDKHGKVHFSDIRFRPPLADGHALVYEIPEGAAESAGYFTNKPVTVTGGGEEGSVEAPLVAGFGKLAIFNDQNPNVLDGLTAWPIKLAEGELAAAWQSGSVAAVTVANHSAPPPSNDGTRMWWTPVAEGIYRIHFRADVYNSSVSDKLDLTLEFWVGEWDQLIPPPGPAAFTTITIAPDSHDVIDWHGLMPVSASGGATPGQNNSFRFRTMEPRTFEVSNMSLDYARLGAMGTAP